MTRILLAIVAAGSISFGAFAQRVSGDVRLLSQPKTSGARTSSSFTVPATAVEALIGIPYFNASASGGTLDPSSVSLDGHTATRIDFADGGASKLSAALYRVSGLTAGSGKTIAYTLSATGSYTALEIGIEFFSSTPTYGAHAGATAASPGPATTSALANVSGDLIYSIYGAKDNFGSPPTACSGQSKLDEQDDMTDLVYFDFTTETGTGSSDAQCIGSGMTANIPAIVSTVMTFGHGQLLSGPTRRLLGGKVR